MQLEKIHIHMYMYLQYVWRTLHFRLWENAGPRTHVFLHEVAYVLQYVQFLEADVSTHDIHAFIQHHAGNRQIYNIVFYCGSHRFD
jgi:hypothetical protein